MAIDDRVGAAAVEEVMQDFKTWLEENFIGQPSHQEQRFNAMQARHFASDYMEAKLGRGFVKASEVRR